MEFKKAERKKAKLRLALCGPSGSGKTLSALRIAKGLGGRVALVDTEGGSGELYADNPTLDMEYDVLQFEPPYTPERAIKAIQTAQKSGYNVVIFDSLSHVWMGEGGMLEMVDNAAKGLQGNSFAAWKNVRPHEKKFLEAITRTPIHIIATMRTKTEWTTEKDPKTGKNRPVKIGLKPEQREGLEYEFTVVFDMTIDGNIASASKDRTDMFKDQYFLPTEETGRKLLAWLERGNDSQTEPQHPTFDIGSAVFTLTTANDKEFLKAAYDNHKLAAHQSGNGDAFKSAYIKRYEELQAMQNNEAALTYLTDVQRKYLMAHYKGWSRESRLSNASSFLGRKIETFSDLTSAEAESFIDAIERDKQPKGA